MQFPRLILASASPRRRELLFSAGYDFEVHPADIDEEDYPAGTLPADLAQLLATLKARALVARFPDDVVLAADTVVAFGDRPLGKPGDETEAGEMLRLLAGTTHVVITGVCVIHSAVGFERAARAMSAVHMRELTDREVKSYVQTGDWRGKAGGYGIQDDHPDPFVTRMSGSHTNIVGLPMELTTELLSIAGVKKRPGAESTNLTATPLQPKREF
jgi:septum formation protein